ncbi:chorismate--pyruvate lyase family protein [Corallincola platygyrae]|uniref:Probable chorismate pyruvate-lyase n=1 Tax=Corallincola platygyrae TaxID=1193278 RepID=A0ABW4XNR7_9GAMM
MQWQAPACLEDADEAVTDWLLDQTSLTARLKQQCQTFTVKVLGEGVQAFTPDEQILLHCRGQRGFVREVVLLCDDRPWVFARTVVPSATLERGKELGQLGSKPLGALLFSTPGMSRDLVEFTQLSSEHGLNQLALAEGAQAKPRELWGRRSRFCLPAGELLLSEIFLPDCQAYR